MKSPPVNHLAVAIPTLATFGVAGTQQATLQIAKLIEQKQRMVERQAWRPF